MAKINTPPGPKRRFPGSFFFNFRRDPLKFLSTNAKKYGDIVLFRIGSRSLYLINHPDLIKDILVTHHFNFHKGRGLEITKRVLGEGLLTSEDDFHKKQRRLIQPAFHKDTIESYGKIMSFYTDKISREWSNNQTLDIYQEMNRITLAIAGKTLFGADVESESKDVREALNTLMDIFNKTVNLPFLAFFEKLPLPMNRKFKTSRERLDKIIFRMIEQRRNSNSQENDLLSLLLNAQDPEGNHEGMSDMQLRDEAMTLFIAGHETTSNTLTWTWYLLSQYPDVEEKLQEELKSLLHGKNPEIKDIHRLEYTRMVLSESLRLYSPAWVIGRRAMNDYPIRQYIIPKNSIILVSQYVMHHDERYYSEPFVFKPERWSPGLQESRPKFSFFPFGGGPRSCIGESFAWLELIIVLATIAQKWKMVLDPSQKVVPKPVITLRSKYGMKMKLIKK